VRVPDDLFLDPVDVRATPQCVPHRMRVVALTACRSLGTRRTRPRSFPLC
jgi:hypothetical protein